MSANTDTLGLPLPDISGTQPLESCLNARRSVRRFRQEGIALRLLSQLLWAGQGITALPDLRTAPSGGALYPLEILVVSGSVEGLEGGTYRYSPVGHSLVRLDDSDKRTGLCAAALGQEFVAQAPVSLVCVAVYERSTVKYGERGMRYAIIEAGHVSQNLYLQAQSLGLGTVIVGAFDDDAVRDEMGLRIDHAPLWVMPVGWPG